MRKLVNESLDNFLDEGFNPKKFFKKVGKFFVALFNNKPIENVELPVNIALNQDDDSFMSMLPAPEDIKLEPSLKSINYDKIAEKLIKSKQDENLYIRESYKYFYDRARLVEEDAGLSPPVGSTWIKLDHEDTEVPNIDADGLEQHIQMILYYALHDEYDKKGKKITMRNMVVWGAPGIGKTEIVRAALKISAHEGKRMIVIQLQNMNPDEWFVPYVMKNSEGDDGGHGYTQIGVKKAWLPVYEKHDDPEEMVRRNNIANGGDANNEGMGGILFFDELSRAKSQVQGSVMNLIADRELDEQLLGDRWVIVTAANRWYDDDESDIKWSTSLGDRLSQFNYIPTVERWSDWAESALIDDAVISFLTFNKQHFYGLKTGPSKHGPSPRSWEAVANMLSVIENVRKRTPNDAHSNAAIRGAIASEVGYTAADAFIAFFYLMKKYSTRDIENIFTNPNDGPKPYQGNSINTPEANAIVSVATSYMRDKDLTPEKFTNFCQYLINLDKSPPWPNNGVTGGSHAGTIAHAAFEMMRKIHPELHTQHGFVAPSTDPDVKSDPDANKYKEGAEMLTKYYKSSTLLDPIEN